MPTWDPESFLRLYNAKEACPECEAQCALQVWLQEFAWTEEEKQGKLERRNRDGPQGRHLAKEPMFCFDFAMNMLYWSALVYDYREVRQCICKVKSAARL
jgi:hypothetical protein